MRNAIIAALAESAGMVRFVPGLFLPAHGIKTGINSVYDMSDGTVVVSGSTIEADLLRTRLYMAGVQVDGYEAMDSSQVG